MITFVYAGMLFLVNSDHVEDFDSSYSVDGAEITIESTNTSHEKRYFTDELVTDAVVKKHSATPDLDPDVRDVCLDWSSFEFLDGGCAGAPECAGAGTLDELGIGIYELDRLMANGSRYADVRLNTCTRPEAGDEEPAGPTLTELVRQEWDQTQLPTPVITATPPVGRTLVNMETWVQAYQDSLEYDITLLGVPVMIQAHPTLWHWDYGDGTPIVTRDHPGTDYPTMSEYHQYREKGTYLLTVTIDWRA